MIFSWKETEQHPIFHVNNGPPLMLEQSQIAKKLQARQLDFFHY